MPIGVEPTPFVRSALRDARIQRSPGHVWIRLPSSMLALPPRTPARAPAGSEAFDEPALDLIESLVQAVRPYLPRGVPSIQLTAEIAGTSVRSLQRALASSGTCYRDVLLKLKLDTARALLRRPDIRIMDVAHEAGFTDHANFTRFFRYCAGMSPRAYRSAHLEGRR
jgi:AraC-like DNA-binding protein